MKAPNQFEIIYHEKPVSVQEFHVQGNSLFRILIPGQAPLTIMRANHQEGHKFWTSVPEGRQELASAIGPLIEKHVKSNQ